MIRHSGFHDASEAALVPMTEAELALGPPVSGKVIEHRGRYWRQSFPGLYEPIHLMARMDAGELSPPSRSCWAYHATVAGSARHRANATEPIHLLADIGTFGPQSVSSNRRYQLRRSLRSTEFVVVTDIDALAAEGFGVIRSAIDRTQNPWRQVDSRDALLDELRWYTGKPSAVILAGLVDGHLGGWIAGYAIGQTAYIEIVDVATDALSSHISIGLHFEFIKACQRSNRIREIVHSPHVPEDPALCTFKASIGFPVTHVPSRFVMAPLVEHLVKRYRPYLYYRLTGRASGPVVAAVATRS